MEGSPLAGLEAIAEEIRGHLPCGFEPCETCTNFVPGEGSATAEVMLVGEAPGGSEDKQGRPFVGRAGKLLDLLLAEAGLERAQVFITNVVKARPPGNRDPKPGGSRASAASALARGGSTSTVPAAPSRTRVVPSGTTSRSGPSTKTCSCSC